jgi:D-psicose/D-tagatose/L-ribulose 3-epimerase
LFMKVFLRLTGHGRVVRLGLAENAWWGTPVDRVTGIKLAKQFGFDTYCVLTWGLNPQLKKEMRSMLREVELPVDSFFVLATSLVDPNIEVRRFTIEFLKRQVDVGYDFDSKTMLLVPGEYLWEKGEVKPEVQWSWLVEGTREVADYASGLGIDIALECETPPYNILRSFDDMLRLIREANHPSIKANIDTVHAFVVGDSPGSIERLAGRIASVHLCDTNERRHAHYPPGRGIAPLKEDLEALKKVSYSGSVNLELENAPEPEKIVEWVVEGYRATDGLMTELNIRN